MLMSGDFIWESGTFLYALWWGMVLAFQYDTIRIIRIIKLLEITIAVQHAKPLTSELLHYMLSRST